MSATLAEFGKKSVNSHRAKTTTTTGRPNVAASTQRQAATTFEPRSPSTTTTTSTTSKPWSPTKNIKFVRDQVSML